MSWLPAGLLYVALGYFLLLWGWGFFWAADTSAA
jgi:hypothetical protein